jgi:predicted RNase H-like nuclease (RuvC/YqgF family)
MTLLIEGLLLDRLVREVERRKDAQAANDEGGRKYGMMIVELEAAKEKILDLEGDVSALRRERDQLMRDNRAWDEKSERMSRGLDALREAAQAYLSRAKGRSKSGLAASLLHKIGEAERLSDSFILF